MSNRKNKIVLFLGFGIILIAISIIFYNKKINSIKLFNESNINFAESKTENANSYLYLELLGENFYNYKLVYKNNIGYVIKTTIDLNNYNFNGKDIRIVGITKKMNDSDKEAFINSYNEAYANQVESMIDSNIYNNYFTEYYLDVNDVIYDNALHKTPYMYYLIFINMGMVFIVLAAYNIVMYKKGV